MAKISENLALDAIERKMEAQETAPEFYPRPEIKPVEPLGADDDSESDAHWPEFFSEKRIKSLEANKKSRPALPPALLDEGIAPDPSVEPNISDHIRELSQSDELRELIASAMDGTMPIEGSIPDGLPIKLNARALQVVMLRIAGYNGPEIASISGFHKVYVQMLLRHPFARRILVVAGASAIAQATATSRSLRRKVPKMLHVVENIATDPSAEAPVRLRAAFGWLDRAGIGPTEKHEVTKTVQGGVTVTHRQASLISTAIRESQGTPKVEEADYEIESDDPQIASSDLAPSDGEQLSLFGDFNVPAN